jgi:hypothetical protein
VLHQTQGPAGPRHPSCLMHWPPQLLRARRLARSPARAHTHTLFKYEAAMAIIYALVVCKCFCCKSTSMLVLLHTQSHTYTYARTHTHTHTRMQLILNFSNCNMRRVCVQRNFACTDMLSSCKYTHTHSVKFPYAYTSHVLE